MIGTLCSASHQCLRELPRWQLCIEKTVSIILHFFVANLVSKGSSVTESSCSAFHAEHAAKRGLW